MLRYLSSGESHGQQLTAIVSDYPSGVEINEQMINKDLQRRQVGYGRGDRMKIESDVVEFLSGVRWGRTTGAPITLVIKNRDWENWQIIMSPLASEIDDSKVITRPRPGHSDLPGMIKFDQKDARNVLERASARETAIRTAVGALCKILLSEFDIHIFSHIISIGNIDANLEELSYKEIEKLAEDSELRCADEDAENKMEKIIDMAKANGDSLGGVIEVIVFGTPPGLGSCMNWDEKLDGKLAQSVMSIQAIKGVEIGVGFGSARMPGSQFHDSIYYSKTKKLPYLQGHCKGFKFYHKQNNAGGIEGGMSNGEAIIIRAAMKPIPTLMTPLDSVDVLTKKPFKAVKERSDVCAVPSAGVVAESAVAFTLAQALLEKFGNDSLKDINTNYKSYTRNNLALACCIKKVFTCLCLQLPDSFYILCPFI